MITGSTIYWITRLDAIGHALVIFTGISGALAIVFAGLFGASVIDDSLDGPAAQYFRRWALRGLVAFFVLLTAVTFVPSSKEMTAILVLPRIANSGFITEQVPAEMADIYGMAKEWLKNVVSQETK